MANTLHIEQVASSEMSMDLLLEADPYEAKVHEYLADGLCFVAKVGSGLVGVYVLQWQARTTLELMNIAVQPRRQGEGIGAKMLRHAIETARQLGAKRLEVGTGTFGYQLAFYQKAGFRVFAVDRDFFLHAYPQPVWENGIQHKDMLRLAIEFEVEKR